MIRDPNTRSTVGTERCKACRSWRSGQSLLKGACRSAWAGFGTDKPNTRPLQAYGMQAHVTVLQGAASHLRVGAHLYGEVGRLKGMELALHTRAVLSAALSPLLTVSQSDLVRSRSERRVLGKGHGMPELSPVSSTNMGLPDVHTQSGKAYWPAACSHGPGLMGPALCSDCNIPYVTHG